MQQQLQKIVDAAWDERANITPENAKAEVRDAVSETIAMLDRGGTLSSREQLPQVIVGKRRHLTVE